MAGQRYEEASARTAVIRMVLRYDMISGSEDCAGDLRPRFRRINDAGFERSGRQVVRVIDGAWSWCPRNTSRSDKRQDPKSNLKAKTLSDNKTYLPRSRRTL